MTNAYIYTLCDPRSGDVRYVGKTIDLGARAKSHLRREKTHKGAWVRSLLTAGVTPRLEVLDVVPHDEWKFWEQHWIQVFRGWGFDLVNGDNGGLGRHRTTKAVCLKISSSLKGRPRPDLCKPVFAYTKAGVFVAAFPSTDIAAEAYGISRPNISRALDSATRLCGGYLWRSTQHASIPPLCRPRRIMSEIVKETLRAISTGRTVGAATRNKQRAARLGKSPANKGVRQSDSLREKHRWLSKTARQVVQAPLNGFVVVEWPSIKYAALSLGVARAGILRSVKQLCGHAGGSVWYDNGEEITLEVV